MSLTAPPDPEDGEAILPWARRVTALLRQIIPRESKDIWPSVRSTGTSFELRRRRAGQAGTSPSPCELKATLVKVGGADYAEFTWGRIAGRQPAGFSAGGVPPYRYAIDLSSPYFLAAANFNWTLLQWDSAWIEANSDPFKDNTTTIAYQLIASVSEEGGVLSIASVCGPVVFDSCSLALV